MRLNRLTGLEQEKLLEEYREIIDTIAELMEILKSERLKEMIKEELVELRELTAMSVARNRRVPGRLNDGGFNYSSGLSGDAQSRGMQRNHCLTIRRSVEVEEVDLRAPLRTEDFIERLMVANTHDTILCFSNFGKVYWLRTFQIPHCEQSSSGSADHQHTAIV